MKYAFNKMKQLTLIILAYIAIVYFLNTLSFQSGFYDQDKITNSKYAINLNIKAKYITTVDYTYIQIHNDDKLETKYFMHLYKQDEKYFFVMSENKDLKIQYFTTTILSTDYLKDIYKKLLSTNNLDAKNIINNFSLISVVQRNDIKLTNNYYLPLWKVVEDEDVNNELIKFNNKINTILK